MIDREEDHVIGPETNQLRGKIVKLLSFSALNCMKTAAAFLLSLKSVESTLESIFMIKM